MSSFWVLNDSCMTNEYLLKEFWRSSERALRKTRMTPAWLADEFRISSKWMLNEFWVTHECLLNQFWRSSEWILNELRTSTNDLWMKSEWVGNETRTAAEWLLMSYLNEFWMTPEWLLHEFHVSSAWILFELQMNSDLVVDELRPSCFQSGWDRVCRSSQWFLKLAVRVTCWDNYLQ